MSGYLHTTLGYTGLLSCTCVAAVLQTARFMLKALLAGKSGKSVGGSAGYLGAGALDQELSSKCSARCPDCWEDPSEC